MTAADRPTDLPELERIAGRILSTLAPWVDNPPTRTDVEQVSQRIATGLDGMYLSPYRDLEQRCEDLQDSVDELTLQLDEIGDLPVDTESFLDELRAWHDGQPDHPGWRQCQHPICRAVREFPWE